MWKFTSASLECCPTPVGHWLIGLHLTRAYRLEWTAEPGTMVNLDTHKSPNTHTHTHLNVCYFLIICSLEFVWFRFCNLCSRVCFQTELPCVLSSTFYQTPFISVLSFKFSNTVNLFQILNLLLQIAHTYYSLLSFQSVSYFVWCSKQLWNKISLYKYVVFKNVGRYNFISVFHTFEYHRKHRGFIIH